MAKRINDEIVSEEIKKIKSETEISDDSDKFIDAEAEKFLLFELLFEKKDLMNIIKKVKRVKY